MSNFKDLFIIVLIAAAAVGVFGAIVHFTAPWLLPPQVEEPSQADRYRRLAEIGAAHAAAEVDIARRSK